VVSQSVLPPDAPKHRNAPLFLATLRIVAFPESDLVLLSLLDFTSRLLFVFFVYFFLVILISQPAPSKIVFGPHAKLRKYFTAPRFFLLASQLRIWKFGGTFLQPFLPLPLLSPG